VTGTDVDRVIAAQAALIAALDASDVAAIEAATTTLSGLLTALRSSGAVVGAPRERVDHALRQSDAARTRINYLADRTRQRLDRLAERRGGRRPATYDSLGRLAGFKG
jgi:hypothetical protein